MSLFKIVSRSANRLKYKTLYTVILFCSLNSYNGLSQCSVSGLTRDCIGGLGTVSNYTNLNYSKHTWTAADGTGSATGLGFGGGTLVVCGGSLTISVNFANVGRIFVNAGAELIVTGNLTLNNSFYIMNRGTLTVNGNVQMNGSSSIYNNGGEITVNGLLATTNSSYIFNDGIINVTDYEINNNTPPGLCQDVGAETHVSQDFQVGSAANVVTTNAGSNCISVGNNISLAFDVSSSSDLLVCDRPGGIQTGPGTWGSAQVISDCDSCDQPLPVDFIYLKAKHLGDYNKVSWATANEVNNDFFTIEKSFDGENWSVIGYQDGAGNSSGTIEYYMNDYDVTGGISYYRIKQTDFDGAYDYSNIVSLVTTSGNSSVFYNNDNIFINTYDSEYQVKLIDLTGKILFEEWNAIHIETSSISEGTYLTVVTTKGGDVFTQKINIVH